MLLIVSGSSLNVSFNAYVLLIPAFSTCNFALAVPIRYASSKVLTGRNGIKSSNEYDEPLYSTVKLSPVNCPSIYR